MNIIFILGTTVHVHVPMGQRPAKSASQATCMQQCSLDEIGAMYKYQGHHLHCSIGKLSVHTHIHVLTHTHTCTHTHMYNVHTYIVHAHAYTYAHTCTHIHTTYMYIHTCTHIHTTYMYIHTCTHTYTHTHIHLHAYTHAHTHVMYWYSHTDVQHTQAINQSNH